MTRRKPINQCSGFLDLLPTLVAPAVHWFIDLDLHGPLGAGESDAVAVVAVAQGDLPVAVGGLAAARAVLKEEQQQSAGDIKHKFFYLPFGSRRWPERWAGCSRRRLPRTYSPPRSPRRCG